jgi:hypothetical protein
MSVHTHLEDPLSRRGCEGAQDVAVCLVNRLVVTRASLSNEPGWPVTVQGLYVSGYHAMMLSICIFL